MVTVKIFFDSCVPSSKYSLGQGTSGMSLFSLGEEVSEESYDFNPDKLFRNVTLKDRTVYTVWNRKLFERRFLKGTVIAAFIAWIYYIPTILTSLAKLAPFLKPVILPALQFIGSAVAKGLIFGLLAKYGVVLLLSCLIVVLQRLYSSVSGKEQSFKIERKKMPLELMYEIQISGQQRLFNLEYAKMRSELMNNLENLKNKLENQQRDNIEPFSVIDSTTPFDDKNLENPLSLTTMGAKNECVDHYGNDVGCRQIIDVGLSKEELTNSRNFFVNDQSQGQKMVDFESVKPQVKKNRFQMTADKVLNRLVKLKRKVVSTKKDSLSTRFHNIFRKKITKSKVEN